MKPFERRKVQSWTLIAFYYLQIHDWKVFLFQVGGDTINKQGQFEYKHFLHEFYTANILCKVKGKITSKILFIE